MARCRGARSSQRSDLAISSAPSLPSPRDAADCQTHDSTQTAPRRSVLPLNCVHRLAISPKDSFRTCRWRPFTSDQRAFYPLISPSSMRKMIVARPNTISIVQPPTVLTPPSHANLTLLIIIMRVRRSHYDFCREARTPVSRNDGNKQHERATASGERAHLDRQEELELRRQLLLRVQTVGEVDSV